MKYKGRFLFYLTSILLMLLSLLLSGCNNNMPVKSTQNRTSYTVTDSTGNKIVFKEPPHRIVSLSLGVDEVLMDMIGPGRIVALTYLADDPGISSIASKASAVKLRTRGANYESIIAMNPDLVLLPDWSGTEQIQGLRDVGIPVYIYKTPVTIKEIQQSILEIAHVVNAEKEGKLLVAEMQKKLDMVQGKLSKIPESEKQTVVAMSLMGAFGGKDTTFDDICRYAYVKNGVAQAGANKNETIPKEVIIKIDPDVLILPSWNFGYDGEPMNFINSIRNDSSLQTIKAIKNDKLIQINDACLYSISHYSANAVEEIAKTVYPEYFKE